MKKWESIRKYSVKKCRTTCVARYAWRCTTNPFRSRPANTYSATIASISGSRSVTNSPLVLTIGEEYRSIVWNRRQRCWRSRSVNWKSSASSGLWAVIKSLIILMWNNTTTVVNITRSMRERRVLAIGSSGARAVRASSPPRLTMSIWPQCLVFTATRIAQSPTGIELAIYCLMSCHWRSCKTCLVTSFRPIAIDCHHWPHLSLINQIHC